ncbi:AAA domain-containing protein [Actinomycetes bacterium KLBMP 9797]
MTGRLSLPSEWAERYLRQHRPELFRPSEFESTRVCLSINPERDYGFDLAHVATDLCSGVVIEERSGYQGPYYVLRGTYHQVYADPATGRDSGIAMAKVSSIKDGHGFGRRDPVRPGGVSFTELWNEEACDLDALTRSFLEALDLVRRRRAERSRAGRALAGGPPEVSTHGVLHGQVRQRYRPLQTVFKLLEARSALIGQVEVTGAAVAADDNRVELELSFAAKLSEDRAVTVHIEDRKYNLPVLAIDGKVCELPQPGSALVVGDRVRIVQKDRFAMAKHNAALAAFLQGRVEGNWDHLAALLTAPETLCPTTPTTSIRYLSGVDLNDEQKAAVAGALATPHAFLIQGPPGTGKTTVIMELILQMVTRGERVLLLAPMHVAVDEVLRRIGDRPEVFPIRLAYDDAKVSDDLQRFLLSRISSEYLRRTRTPGKSKAEEWQQHLDRLATDQQRMVAHIRAAEAVARAVDPEARSAESYRAWESWFQASWAASTQRLQFAQQTLGSLSETAPAADRRAVALRAQMAAVPTGQRVRSWFRQVIGQADELQRLRIAAQTATTEAARLADAHQGWTQEYGAAQAALQGLGAVRDSRGRHLYGVWQQHRRALETAEEALRQAATASGLPASVAPHARLTEVDDQIAVLKKRIALEQRWFDLVRPEEPDRLTRELRLAANVICCTTTGVTAKALEGLDFDTLIIDEASRVIDSEFLIGAVRARRWIMVGDEHQLPPYVEPADEHHLHALAALHKAGQSKAQDLRAAVDELATVWREDEEMHAFRTEEVLRQAERCLGDDSWPTYYRDLVTQTWPQFDTTMLRTTLDHLVRSLFERTVTTCPNGLRQRLVEQRRMIEPIADLVKDPVYGGDYRTPDAAKLAPLGVTPLTSTVLSHPVTLLDTSSYGERARHRQYKNGCFNPLEVDWVVATCRRWESELRSVGGPPVTVSVLAFYRRQATLIREALGWPSCRAFRALKFQVIDSIDKIQGQEADLVIVSFCRAYLGRNGPRRNAGLWLQDIRRLNVACTRARRALTLVGHGDTLRRLTGLDPAERFYANVFHLLDSGAEGYGLVKDL